MTPQELKNSILQLAIQGKLVEQRPEEGTAEELYRQIQEEKKRLIKEGKIKKEKPLPEIAEDEKPFEIPESWKWVHLNYIAVSSLGKTLDKVKNTGNLQPYLCSINVYWNGISLEKVKKARFEETELPKYLLQKGDLLICEGGDVGRSSVWNQDVTMYYQNALHRVRFYQNINPYFYKYLIECYKGIGIIDKYSKGVTIKHLVQNSLNAMWLPLPPLAEQKRIVAKIEDLLPYIDRYEQAWNRLEDFNRRFPIDMQKSLLQWAIQGKLVEKGEEAWKYVRFGDAITLLSGTDFKPEEYNDKGEGIPYITGASSLLQNGVLVNRWTQTPRNIAELGDVLLVCKGSGYGKTVICDVKKAHIARQIMAVKKSNMLDMKYVQFFLMASLTQIKAKGQGVIPGIDRKSVLNLKFPFPPLAEQKRIVAKLEELLPLCERLR